MARINSFSHAVDFTDPTFSSNAAGSVSVEPGIGVNGSTGLRIRPPLSGQDRCGYTQIDMPPTKRLHVRMVIKALTPLPSCKWLIARRFTSTTVMDETTDLEGCGRFIVQTNPYGLPGEEPPSRFIPWPTQGVCSEQRDAQDQFIQAAQCDFNWNDYIGQEVALEFVGDLDAGFYSVYVSTPDGRYSGSLFMQIDLATGMPFNLRGDPLKIEQVPSPSWFGQLDPMYWNNPAPAGTECILSGMVISDSWIGSPFSAVPAPAPTPDPAPEPAPAPVLAPEPTGGRMVVMVNDVEVSQHTQLKEAQAEAGRRLLNNPAATVVILTDPIRFTLE